MFEAFSARRRNIEGPAPDMHLLRPAALSRLILVESREIAVIAFVERHVPSDFEIPLAKLGEDQIERMLGAFEHAREGDVEPITGLLEFPSRRLGLFYPCGRQVGVLPAGEQVLEIPF